MNAQSSVLTQATNNAVANLKADAALPHDGLFRNCLLIAVDAGVWSVEGQLLQARRSGIEHSSRRMKDP